MSTSPRDRRRRIVTVAIVAAAVVAADQITKTIALDHLQNGPVHLFGPFSFQLEYNSGVAFSIGTGGSTVPIVILAAVVIGALIWFARSTPSMPAAAALGLVLGGAAGNLSDRFFRPGGKVVDFVHSTFWPTFNFADSCITVGCIGLALLLLRRPPPNNGRLPTTAITTAASTAAAAAAAATSSSPAAGDAG